MQKVAMDQNLHSQFQPVCPWPNICIINLNFIYIFNFQNNNLSESWDSWTNQYFLAPGSSPTGPCLRKSKVRTQIFFWLKWMKFGRYISLRQSHRVTTFPCPIPVGEILMSIFNNLSNLLSSQGDKLKQKIEKRHWVPSIFFKSELIPCIAFAHTVPFIH